MTPTWRAADAARWLTPPAPDDHKYSRGVLGCVTGSDRYPGAAVLGVDAALRTGVGMVRYRGPAAVGRLVLERRPEAVLAPGRVHAWVAGSGIDAADAVALEPVRDALAEDVPVVLDAGALGLAGEAEGPKVLTPHAGELAERLGMTRARVEAEPAEAAGRYALDVGGVVLLKGPTTWVTDGSRVVAVTAGTPWLATAGTGDSLAGILGALLAARTAREPDVISQDTLVSLAATAAFLHGGAARRAAGCATDGSGGGPFTVLELNARVPEVVSELLG